MNDKKNVLILSAIDPTRAYSCIKYLYMALTKNSVDVECWCKVPKENMESYLNWGRGTRSFNTSRLSSIPKIGTLYMIFRGYIECIKYRNNTIICNDLFHYKACCLVKKLFPLTRVIVYFTEIYNEQHSKYLFKLQKFFEKHPNNMDLMIECDFKREQYRIRCNGVNKKTDTILNTIPFEEIQSIRCKEKKKCNDPVIVYSGGIHEEGEFSIIIDALRKIDLPYRMDFYCFGSQENLKALHNECETKIKNKYRIITNKSREEVLKNIADADVGIVYYDPEYSVNTKYAAPTKFFEYVSLGIPVVTSGNESLIDIINKYQLGSYMKSNNVEGMKEAIYRLISSVELRNIIRKNETEAFDHYLCYERQSENAMKKISDLINLE